MHTGTKRIIPLLLIGLVALDSFAQNVGVGTSNPVSKLHVVLGGAEVQDVVRFSKGSTDFMIMNEGGNIGIGVSSPTAPLHTAGNVRFEIIGGTGIGIVQSNANGLLQRLDYPNNNSVALLGDGTWGTLGSGSTDSDWFDAPGTTDAPTNIASDIYTLGNVGIGHGQVGSHSLYAPLHVATSAYIGDDNSSGIPVTAATTALWLSKANEPHLHLEDIAGNTAAIATGPQGLYLGTNEGDFLFKTDHSSGDSSLVTTGKATLVIKNASGSNNVGIGTILPTAKLQVTLNGSETQDLLRLNQVGNNRLVVTAAGNVGIGLGSSPTSQLHTSGTVRFEALGGATTGIVQASTTGELSRNDYSNDANQVLRGDGTWGSSPGNDVDWAQIGSLNSPTTINDWLYTMGNIGINYGSNVGENPYAALHVQTQAYIGDANGSGFFNTNPVVWIAKINNPHLFLEDITDNVGGLSLDATGLKVAVEAGDFQIRTGITNNAAFNATGNIVVAVENNGFTGIGRDNPLGILHVQGTLPIVRVYDPNLANGALSIVRIGKADVANQALGIEHKQDATTSRTSFHYFGDNFGDALVVEKGGEVGIGTETPGHKLDVVGDIRTTTGNLRSGVGGTAQINIFSNGSTRIQIDENNDGNESFAVLDGTDSQQFGVDESGNVDFEGDLIGDAAYDISGTSGIDLMIDADNSSTTDEFKVRKDGATPTDLLTVQEDGDVIINGLAGNGLQLAEIDNDGKIGVKPYPGPVTDVLTGDGNWTDVSTITGDNLGNHIATQTVQMDSNWISFDNDPEGLFVTRFGNVGVGSDTASFRLHINTADTFGRAIKLWGQHQPDFIGYGAKISWGDGDLVYIEESGDDTLEIYGDQGVIINSTNGVGINTAPTSNFHVFGSIRLDDGNAQNGYIFGAFDVDGNAAWVDPLNVDPDWLVTGNDMTAIPTGNVGIGVAMPIDKLQVNGNVRINDSTLILRGGTAVNDYIQYSNNGGIDGPRIAGNNGIEFYRSASNKVLGTWDDDRLDVNGYLLVGDPVEPNSAATGSIDNKRLYHIDFGSASNAWWANVILPNCVSNHFWSLQSDHIRYTGTEITGDDYSVQTIVSPYIWIPSHFDDSLTVELDHYSLLEADFDGTYFEADVGSGFTKVTDWESGDYPGNIAGSTVLCGSSAGEEGWDVHARMTSVSYKIPSVTPETFIRVGITAEQDQLVSGGSYEAYELWLFANMEFSTSGFEPGGIYAQGHVFAQSTAQLGDVAEYFGIDESSKPGYLISMQDGDEQICKVTDSKMDPKVIGVQSTAPSILVNDPNSGVAVGLSGRVPVKISLENGSISAGDYLTASSLRGHAMKATESCYIVGRAMTSSKHGSDEVICLIAPGWYNPVVTSNEPISGGTNHLISGKSSLKVFDENITAYSKIFVTMRANPGAAFWVSSVQEGAFELELSDNASSNAEFDYLVYQSHEIDKAAVAEEMNKIEAAKAPVADPEMRAAKLKALKRASRNGSGGEEVNDFSSMMVGNLLDPNGEVQLFSESQNPPGPPPDPSKFWTWTPDKGYEEYTP